MASDVTRLAGVGDAAVLAKTGKTWTEWLAVLDAGGAAAWPHAEIARYLAEQHRVPDWWCQMVTVGYEQARGLRQVHEKADGFTANASKTAGVPVMRLYEAWTDDAQREHWLPAAVLVIRKATPGKSLRITWADGSNLDVTFYAKGEGKSQVAVQHSRLPDAGAAASLKQFWGEALERLRLHLEAGRGTAGV